MLVRLLLAVLTVAGPVPVRVCTCAATAGEPAAPASRPAEPEPTRGCGCKRHRAEESPAAGACGQTPSRALSDSHRSHDPGDHDRDCPAASPQPVMLEGTTTTVDSPADAVTLSPLPVAEPSDSRLTRPLTPTAYRLPLPLYLSLLAIRI